MAEFRLANALSDHMVLQRDSDVRIWGKGKNEGDVIYAVMGPYESYGIVDNKGEFEVYLPPMPANILHTVFFFAILSSLICFQLPQQPV